MSPLASLQTSRVVPPDWREVGPWMRTADVREPVNALEILDGGAIAYPRMLDAIAHARTRVHLEVYSFARSGIGATFVEELSRASARGVAVDVVIDGWGSFRDGRAVAAALEQAGCEVKIFNRFRTLVLGRFGRMHRKILVVDDEVAFLGGINIGDCYAGDALRAGWADLALEIRGDSCLVLARKLRGECVRPIDALLRLTVCDLGGGWRLRDRYRDAFANARRSISVVHGYFVPDPSLVLELAAAARRGLEVRLLLAGRSNVPLFRVAARSFHRSLMAAGVSVREWDHSVLHAKLAIVDGRQVLLGSFNLDPFSLVNREALAEVTDGRVADQASAWVARHWAKARPVPATAASTMSRRWLLDPLGRLVALLAGTFSRWTVGSDQPESAPSWRTPRGSVSFGTRTSKELGIGSATLYRKLKRYGLIGGR